jgi:hypothetical protein
MTSTDADWTDFFRSLLETLFALALVALFLRPELMG